ncbi:GSCOCG00003869001-RA-CDS, partial [Cotesia congregata]
TYSTIFDFSKAFDYLNPEVLLVTLFEMGFSIESIHWFHSYLSGRTQSVVNNFNIPSKPVSTTSGVPQGSILGPILFLLAINGVTKRLSYCKHGLFADDKWAYLHFKLSRLNDAGAELTADAQAIADWAKEYNLEINFKKTKVMILGSKRKLKLLDGYQLPEIVVDGNIIPYVNTTKHLGVHLSSDLSWDAHVSQLSRKAYITLNNLKDKKNVLSESCRKLLVTATILPIIDYCSIVFLDSSKRLDSKLQRIVNRAIRFIFNLKRDEHITPYIIRRRLNWLSVKSRRHYSLACFIYK